MPVVADPAPRPGCGRWLAATHKADRCQTSWRHLNGSRYIRRNGQQLGRFETGVCTAVNGCIRRQVRLQPPGSAIAVQLRDVDGDHPGNALDRGHYLAESKCLPELPRLKTETRLEHRRHVGADVGGKVSGVALDAGMQVEERRAV